ncbi:MAG: RnfABCDGE type electron transport complex subunit D [Paludibacteraceae bacterium]|nr:RnfABCDGE type electron transport complex subunit D [Paludibacteraceae bacterium]
MKQLIVSAAPHVHSGDSVRRNMLNVIIALLPAFIVSVVAFGWGVLIVSATSVASCLLFEWLIAKFIMKEEPTIGDCSAVLTGLLLAFNLPSNLPLWIVVIGALVAIGVGKMSYGGLGQNPFNPALVGRVFLLISFPVQMTTWPRPLGFSSAMPFVDAETGATPLAIMKNAIKAGDSSLLNDLPTLWDMAVGYLGGSFGEVSAIALLIGGIYLLCTKTITWHIPVSILCTVAIFSGILFLTIPGAAAPQYHLLTGGLMLGAIFMATDYVTSPMTPWGQIIYGIGIGLIVVIIRTWGAYPEGMSFAILIMNAVTTLLNMYIRPKRFGEKKKA